MRWVRVRQLDHALAQVCLDDLDAKALEIGVEADLLGRHRFALRDDHSRARRQAGPRVPAQLADDLPRFVRVLGEVHDSADRSQPFGELFEQLGQPFEVCLTPALEVGATFREVEALKGGVSPAAQPGHRVDQGFLQLGIVKGAIYPPRELASTFRHALERLL